MVSGAAVVFSLEVVLLVVVVVGVLSLRNALSLRIFLAAGSLVVVFVVLVVVVAVVVTAGAGLAIPVAVIPAGTSPLGPVVAPVFLLAAASAKDSGLPYLPLPRPS